MLIKAVSVSITVYINWCRIGFPGWPSKFGISYANTTTSLAVGEYM